MQQAIISTVAMGCVAVPAGAAVLGSAILRLDSRQAQQQAAQAIHTVNLITASGRLIHQLQRERSLSIAFMTDTIAAHTLAEQRRDTDRMVTVFSQACADVDGNPILLAAKDGLISLFQVRQQINDRQLSSAELLRAYSGRIGAVQDLISLKIKKLTRGKMSRLGTAYVHLLAAKELAGLERSLLTSALARDHLDMATRRKVAEMQDGQTRHLTLFRDHVSQSLYGQCQSIWNHSDERVSQLRMAVLDETASHPLPKPKDWFPVATIRIDAMKRCEEILAEQLLQTAQKHLQTTDQFGRQFVTIIAASALVAGGMVFFSLGG